MISTFFQLDPSVIGVWSGRGAEGGSRAPAGRVELVVCLCWSGRPAGSRPALVAMTRAGRL
ncbi:hypothetical protein HMPREF9056_02498 [Actinomyces sp. oral taxon 170 str. F0386]|nr:hypothetical protein HMPREF9056_02498 [Actinomyces sp. oral taxon 170 str. F0386]